MISPVPLHARQFFALIFPVPRHSGHASMLCFSLDIGTSLTPAHFGLCPCPLSLPRSHANLSLPSASSEKDRSTAMLIDRSLKRLPRVPVSAVRTLIYCDRQQIPVHFSLQDGGLSPCLPGPAHHFRVQRVGLLD